MPFEIQSPSFARGNGEMEVYIAGCLQHWRYIPLLLTYISWVGVSDTAHLLFHTLLFALTRITLKQISLYCFIFLKLCDIFGFNILCVCVCVNLSFFFHFFISWRLISLQYCSGFCHTLTWISHGFTCIPHPDPPSHLPLYPFLLGLPNAPGPITCLMHPTWAGDLFHYR